MATLGQPFRNRRRNVVTRYEEHSSTSEEVFNLLDWYYANVATGEPVQDAQKAATYLGVEPGTFNTLLWRARGTADMIVLDDLARAAGLYGDGTGMRGDEWVLTRVAVIMQFLAQVDL
jgi:hypothetical protein